MKFIRHSRYKDILFFFGLSFVLLSCENKNDVAFQINGKLEADLDSIHIYPGFISKKLLDTPLYNFSSAVHDGNFSFEGFAPYPQMLTLHSPKVGISLPFFIEKGQTDLNISFVNRDRKVKVAEKSKSKTQKEYEVLVSTKLNPISQKLRHSESREERKKFFEEIDMAIISHLKDDPNSYVALWLMIDRFCRSGSEYNENYLNALDLFSDEIRNISLYKNFKNNLIERKHFSFSDKKIPLKSLNGEQILLDFKKSENKYVLIDFWFSYCQPCLLEMPEYIPIYNKYKNYGFEIMSISIDKSTDVTNWIRVIEENEFNWLHFLDENGIETRKLEISSFPTTFLVDRDGRIIEKNISVERLEHFLNTNLIN